ncbi:MAG: glycosyltransferase family 39 protein [Exilibacterium sp.]
MSTLNFLINRSTLPLLACLLLWFALLGYRDLIDPDEGRYAEISREMVASGNWITPHLNGFKYFEKPPLQYWTTATIFTVFGENNTTARLWVAAIGFAGALWAGFVGTRLYGRNAGYYAFIITLSGLLYFGNAHYLTLDTTLTVFVVLALGSLVLAQHQRRQPASNRAWMLLGWAALAAAVLSKGLIGLVLPAGATVFYSLWQRDWNLWRHLHLIKGATLLLLLTVPWFIAVSTRNDEFAHFFFVREHLQRYTTPVHGHNGPIWYFPVVFLLATAPWLTTSIMSLVKPSFGWRPRPRSGEFNAERLLWVFVVFVLFFSPSATPSCRLIFSPHCRLWPFSPAGASPPPAPAWAIPGYCWDSARYWPQWAQSFPFRTTCGNTSRTDRGCWPPASRCWWAVPPCSPAKHG